MGHHIISLANELPGFIISGAVDASDSPHIGSTLESVVAGSPKDVIITDSLESTLDAADVVIDFTWPDNVMNTAQICSGKSVPLVIGTTGIDNEKQNELKRLFTNTPCVAAPNMSVGVNLLFQLVEQAAKTLGDAYDIEITEAHHRFKKDSPSGTALKLADIAAEAMSRSLDEYAVYGRQGMTGERTQKEIGIHAIRMGDVVGEHTVNFATLGERLELTHKAQSRNAFAQGALRAAKYVVSADPGVHDMIDVLGLR
jgi:4-hydroxy-tetrahydrodipicolinate reductase